MSEEVGAPPTRAVDAPVGMNEVVEVLKTVANDLGSSIRALDKMGSPFADNPRVKRQIHVLDYLMRRIEGREEQVAKFLKSLDRGRR